MNKNKKGYVIIFIKYSYLASIPEIMNKKLKIMQSHCPRILVKKNLMKLLNSSKPTEMKNRTYFKFYIHKLKPNLPPIKKICKIKIIKLDMRQ